jgi:DNA-binding XRE family transcriptional regulator
MRKAIKIPRIIRVNAIHQRLVYLVFNNGEHRVFDFERFSREQNFAGDPLRAGLLQEEVFQKVVLHEGTLRWPLLTQQITLSNGLFFEVPFDLDPVMVYENSIPDLERNSGLQIGLMLRQARVNAGLTQAELALRSGTTKHYISRIENNHADIEMGTLLKIVEIGLGKHLEITVR